MTFIMLKKMRKVIILTQLSLWYSCLGNLIHRGAWRAIVHGVAESDTTERLNNSKTRHLNLWDLPVKNLSCQTQEMRKKCEETFF